MSHRSSWAVAKAKNLLGSILNNETDGILVVSFEEAVGILADALDETADREYAAGADKEYT